MREFSYLMAKDFVIYIHHVLPEDNVCENFLAKKQVSSSKLLFVLHDLGSPLLAYVLGVSLKEKLMCVVRTLVKETNKKKFVEKRCIHFRGMYSIFILLF